MSKKRKASKKTKGSKKTEVVEILFDQLWSKSAADFSTKPPIVTSSRLVEAIRKRNERHKADEKKGLSSANPANFLKDLIRKRTCNKHWPKSIANLKISARQRYGNEQVFEFVRFKDGDLVPFPDRYDPVKGMQVLKIESLSLPRWARALGRADEAWLTQVVVYQKVVHTQLATFSSLNVLDLTHLQMSVKTQPEIDAVFVATIEKNDREVRALVTCEAKQHNERLLEDQIREQVQQAFGATKEFKGPEAIEAVIPMAVSVAAYEVDGRSVRGIYVAEFSIVDRAIFEKDFAGAKLHEMPLDLESRAFYILSPPIRGISFKK